MVPHEMSILHKCQAFMMTSSNGNISGVTGHLCGEFTGHRWIPYTKASVAELWCFLWSAPEWIVRLVIWDTMVLIMASLWCYIAFAIHHMCTTHHITLLLGSWHLRRFECPGLITIIIYHCNNYGQDPVCPLMPPMSSHILCVQLYNGHT